MRILVLVSCSLALAGLAAAPGLHAINITELMPREAYVTCAIQHGESGQAANRYYDREEKLARDQKALEAKGFFGPPAATKKANALVEKLHAMCR